MSQHKVIIQQEGFDAFLDRVRDKTRRADRGEEIPNATIISFSSADDLLETLTPQRKRLLEAVLVEYKSISVLQDELHRARSAITRDISLLERLGLLITQFVSNPGHGQRKEVRAAARKIELKAFIG